MTKSRALPINEAIFTVSEEEVQAIKPETSQHDNIIGQPRALEALKMGIKIRQKGYNIFVSGQTGTGKKTAIHKLLEMYKSHNLPQKDIALAYNFKRPDHPKPLYFDAGEARKFQQDLKELVVNLRQHIRVKLESPGYNRIKNEIIASIKDHERRILQNFELRLNQDGFTAINQDAEELDAIDIALSLEEGAVTIAALEDRMAQGLFAEDRFLEIRNRYFILKDELQAIFRAMLRSKNQMNNELEALKVITVTPEIQVEIEGLRLDYPEETIHAFLEALTDDIAKNLGSFMNDDGRRKSDPSQLKYEINILREQSSGWGQPIIYEAYPTYKNLFGFVDAKSNGSKEPTATHLDVKGGAFLHASGGYLLINADDLIKEEQAWKYVKRTLGAGTITILPDEAASSTNMRIVIPEEIMVDVKVILMGNENLYDVLFSMDQDFARHFKIAADFDSTMIRSTETMGHYLHFIDFQCEKNNIRPLNISAKAEVIRYGALLAEDRAKLSTCFAHILDLLIEAEYWAMDAPVITGEIIRIALDKRRYMGSLPEEKINEMIANGDIHIPLGTPQVGQVNALAIHERGFISFGTPCLISAQSSPGDSGIINIEGEVGLSGEIHDKWVYILEGYLRHHYTPHCPLTLYATLCFEQSYGEIDGDSAAVSEMCALLSSISQIPLRQTIAVTGSLSQTGLVQPVGGVSEKIEGFFTVCSQMPLTGEHGVIIPRHNVKNLILAPEVEKAIQENLFHIYPVETLNEAIEILSGLPAGIWNEDWIYPEGSFNYLVEKRLKDLHSLVKGSDEPDQE